MISSTFCSSPLISNDANKLEMGANEGRESSPSSPTHFLRCLIPERMQIMDGKFSYNKATPTCGYTMEAVEAIRANDIPALRYLLDQGHCFDACNANGEYLLHLACRRGEPETVAFLVNEAKVNVNVRDVMGRTIIHDLVWKSFIDVEMMTTVLKLVHPTLLLAKDIRGHTPFDFARKHHWKKWVEFLQENQDAIEQKLHDA